MATLEAMLSTLRASVDIIIESGFIISLSYQSIILDHFSKAVCSSLIDPTKNGLY
ncbi:MAG: hypothetical protein ACI8R1_001614 [Psychrobacter glaciei]|jgi:hypothetical protein